MRKCVVGSTCSLASVPMVRTHWRIELLLAEEVRRGSFEESVDHILCLVGVVAVGDERVRCVTATTRNVTVMSRHRRVQTRCASR